MSDGRRSGTGEGALSVVTLDGPAGSGKSTTARAVARELGYRYLDSGALYRALTFALLDAGRDPEEWPDLDGEALGALGVRVVPGDRRIRVFLGDRELDAELRSEEVTARVSELAAIPAVRSWLLDAQRQAGRRGRLVADGRDMGPVVFPDAGAKIFLDADPRERARRRLRDKGVDEPDDEEVEAERDRLETRDRRDRQREHAPLRKADGALVVDTTRLEFEEQVRLIADYARSVATEGGGPTR